MNYMTGLDWSAGLFGLSIGIVFGCVATWFSMRVKVVALDDPILSLNELPVMEAQIEAQIYGDVPVVPPCNPLHARMFERWLEAEGMGDRFMQNRQEGRMLLAGIEPPTSREEAESRLTKLKGASL